MIVADRRPLQSAAVMEGVDRNPVWAGLRLLAAEGVGPVAAGQLLAAFGSVDRVVRAPESA